MENNKVVPFSFVKLYDNEHIKLMYPILGLVDIPYNRYYITDFGRFFSLSNRNNKEFYEMKPSETTDGYLEIHLSNNGYYNIYKIARLVLFYFDSIPDNPLLYDANHIDYNRKNNHLSNLEWLTHEENIKYSYCNRDRITDEQMLDIYDRIYNKGQSYDEVAEVYNRSRRTIVSVANGANHYKEQHDRLGLPDMRRHVIITTKTIIDIYNDLRNGMNRIECAKKYNVSERVVTSIRMKKERYGEILKDFPDIEKSTNHKFTKEEALSIHNDIISSSLTNRELCDKYNITSLTLRDIKFCVNGYSFLKEMGAVIPEKGISHRNYSNKDNYFKNRYNNDFIILGIYEQLKSGRSASSIAKELKCNIDPILDIKLCINSYSYLQDKYGLEPLN